MLRRDSLILRLAAVVTLLAAVLFAPWWAAMAFIAAYVWVFRLFIEVVLISWLIDTSFSTDIIPWVSLAVLIYVIVVEVVVYYISH